MHCPIERLCAQADPRIDDEGPFAAPYMRMAKATTNKLTSGDVQDLAVAVEQLTEETRLLRMSLDEIRDDVVWATRQVLASGYQVSGTPPPDPRDPLAPEMRPPVSVPRRNAPTVEHAMNRADESLESPYCCDRPRLAWNGDPDAPGVACENCGYVIADNGSVVIWRDEDEASTDGKPEEPEQRQGSLFE